MIWTEKYRPKSFKEVIGNGKQKKEIEAWVDNWKNNNVQKPLLLIGPAGTGKTTMAHIIAKEFNEYIELNASDERRYDDIKRTIGESSNTQSLFKTGHKLIILDEVDGMHGTNDRGGTRAIGNIIKETKHPMVMMANDFYSKRLTSIKPKTLVVKMGKVHTNSINALLKKIAIKEGIDADPQAIKQLALNSNGDMRYALNTFQSISEGNKTLTIDDLSEVSSKDNRSTIFDAVQRVLKSKDIVKVKESLRLDEDPTLVLEYIAENIPREYEKKDELKKSYNMISEADIYFSRARNTRNYIYWRYASEFMGAGVALSKHETYKKFTKLTGPTAFTYMGRTKGKRALRDSIAEKMSKRLHISNSEAITSFPYLEIMFENDELAWDISDFLSLEEDEIKRFRSKKIPKKVITKKEKEKAERLMGHILESSTENTLFDSLAIKTPKTTNEKKQDPKNKKKKENQDKKKQRIENEKNSSKGKPTKNKDEKSSKQTTLFNFG
ncbi:MAG: replication factor C large subunit [Methanobrevibacter sp.]|jgi:replication factor C large subunit|nr:replication factor C large subunit [Candidatus Methanovirga australis]